MLNVLKEGLFDLAGPIAANNVDLGVSGNHVHNDAPIRAYWCPFIQGNVLPGFVDVPRAQPDSPFVFTAAMNGCAFVITDSPNHGYFRVYHHQHPDSAFIWNLIHQQGQVVRSFLGFAEYGVAANVAPNAVAAPNAFNFLHYQFGMWSYVVQRQHFNMLTLQCQMIGSAVIDVGL